MEKPILFSGPMVQAILDDCKTQTRRVVTRKDFGGSMLCDAALKNVAISPYGAVGDRLWVRETFCDTGCMRAVYRASTKEENWKWRKWKPSIFMPRWASRITLEITGVRIERVREISEADAWAEGYEVHWRERRKDENSGRPAPVGWFAALWNSINASRGYPWSKNPPVWVISFRRIT
jgi:hypothetical protein